MGSLVSRSSVSGWVWGFRFGLGVSLNPNPWSMSERFCTRTSQIARAAEFSEEVKPTLRQCSKSIGAGSNLPEHRHCLGTVSSLMMKSYVRGWVKRPDS